MKEDRKTANSALKIGIFSALMASLCCLGPLVLVLLGVGGASTALSIGYRKPYFLVFGLAILVIGFYLIYRKNCKRKHLSRRQQLVIFGGSFMVSVLLYYLLTYVLTPLIAPFVYQYKFSQ